MRLLRGWLLRLVGMVDRGRRERDLSEELDAHPRTLFPEAAGHLCRDSLPSSARVGPV